MAVNLSALGGAGWQFFDNAGTTLSGGKMYAYEAGTVTPATTYTSSAGDVPNTNPIILNSAGRPSSQIWLTDNQTYKFVLATSDDVVLWTMDNVPSIGTFDTVSIADLPAVAPAAGDVVFVNDLNREGNFVCKAGTAPSDPLQGLYVSSNTSGFYWEREWDKINGYPEWFGAVTNSNIGIIPADNVAAIHACLALCPVVNFGRADYWINATLKFNVPYRTILGWVRSDGYDTGHGTRIISVNASANVIQVGPDTMPGGGTSNFLRNITVQNLSAQFGVGITPPSAGNESSAVKHWLVQYVLNCQIKDCAAWEPIIGFYFYGCVYTKVDDCQVFRSAVFGGTNDFFRGYWPQGAPAILAGGNPSLYINRCNASMGGSPALVNPTGLYINGDFSDIFIDDFETSQVAYGIWIDNVGAAAAYGRLDLHIRNVVIDQCNGIGILVNALNTNGMVTVTGGYIQINDNGTTSNGMWITGSGVAGSISIGGGLQLVSAVGTSNQGVYVSGQSNVTIDDTVMIHDFFRPVVIDGASEQVYVGATINNPNTGNGTSPAVGINNASRLHIAPKINGGAGVFAQGILSVGTGTNKSVFDPTMFNSAALSLGAASKVLINSISISAPGYYTTAGASGSSGDGIFVTGITA